MKKEVVITGAGIIAPKAYNKNDFWSNLKNGINCIETITKCDTSFLETKIGGQVFTNDIEIKINKRFLNKCDLFSIYSLLAIEEAIDDAKLSFKDIDKDEIGLYIGNNSGGWNACSNALHSLHSLREDVSPFLASNWFPAAPQGHSSIYFKIHGYSKTIAADMASSTIAIGNAAKLIQEGKMDLMIAGGVENLINSWGLHFYESSKTLSKRTDPAMAYLPFDYHRSGLVLAEGACFLILEEREHARNRGANIYAELKSFYTNNDGYHYFLGDPHGKEYSNLIKKILKGERPDYISLNGSAVKNEDESEINGICNAFDSNLDGISISCPKAFWGNAFGASGAMDTLVSLLSIQNSLIIKSGFVSAPDIKIKKQFVYNNNLEKNISSALVLNKGFGGINSALFLKKYKNEN